ncbi:Cytochrome P450 CYP749A22 [Linum grandiflorum]
MFWIGPRAQLVLMEPEIIREALCSKDDVFPKTEAFTSFHEKILGDGVTMSRGDKWAKVRKLANVALHGEKLKGLVPDMIASVEVMLEKWKKFDGKEIEVHEEFRILSSEVISKTGFGSSFEEGQQIFEMLHGLMVLAERNTYKISLPVISKIFKSKDEIESERLDRGIRDSIMKIVRKRQDKVKSGEMEGYGDDYFGMLIKAYNEEDESRRIDVEQLIDECKTLYVAGQETTNTLLSWIVLLLSIHQDWQEEARKEVIDLFGRDRNPDADGISRLKIAGMIINETLRLYPPVAMSLMRNIDQDVTLGKLKVPAGVQFHVPFMSVHHDPEIWGEDVYLFKPDRFAEGVVKATNNNPVAFIPFGMGPHICAGFNFAVNEAKVTLAMILQRFSFSLSPGYVHSPFALFALRPGKGLQFDTEMSTLFLIIISASLCFLCVLLKLLHNLLWKPLKTQRFLNSQGIYGPPYRFLLGNVKDLISFRNQALSKPMSSLSHDVCPRILPHLSFWAEKYGKIFMFWIGPRPQLVLTEPDIIKEALCSKDDVFPKTGPYTSFHEKILGGGLTMTGGDKWVKVRKLTNVALHGEKLKGLVPDMIASVEIMLEKWKQLDGKEVEVHQEFMILSSDMISRTAFGSSFEEGQEIFKMFNGLMVLAERNTFKITLPIISKIFKSKDEIESERLDRGIRESIMKIVRKRQDKVKSGEMEGYGNDYLGMLIRASNDRDESRRIDVDHLIDECKTLYVAGQETTNSLLSWIVLLLSIHQDWQEEARKEVVDLYGRDRNPDADGISRLKIVGMIINETLRLYSPVYSSFMRNIDQDVTLGKLKVPAGVQFHVPFMSVHHDPDIWGEDVYLFKPDRFAEGVVKATNNNPAAFMPFGMGPHICAGYNFALSEAKITLAMILQRFSFSLSPGYVHSPFALFALRPEKGLQPFKTQRILASQGVKGPDYRFVLGNAKQLIQLRNEALAKPMSTVSHDISRRCMPSITIWAEQYGRPFAFWIGPRAQLVLTKPEDIKEVMNTKYKIFPKAELYSIYLKKIFGEGIVMSEDAKWSKAKKLANFAFHGNSLKGMIPDMVGSVEMMLERWKSIKEGEEIEVHQEFGILTSEIISRTAFGSSFQEGIEIFRMLHKMMDLAEVNMYTIRLPFISSMFKTKAEKEAELLEKGTEECIMKIVSKRKEKMKNGDIDGYGSDFVGMLIKACHEEDETKKISTKQLIDDCRILYTAGQETGNSMLSWIMLLLSVHQDWQEAAREEVIKTFGHEQVPHVDGIAKLKNLGMIVLEALRLYSPVYTSFIRDIIDEEGNVTLGKLTRLSQVQVHIPILVIHHDSKIWGEDVHLFNPKRFEDGIAKATNNNPAAFLPFGLGPHKCVGFNFIQVEGKVTLAMILQRYSFTLSPGYVHAPYPGVTLRPQNGVQIILKAL